MPLRSSGSIILPEEFIETRVEDAGITFILNSRAPLTEPAVIAAMERIKPMAAAAPDVWVNAGTVRYFV